MLFTFGRQNRNKVIRIPQQRTTLTFLVLCSFLVGCSPSPEAIVSHVIELEARVEADPSDRHALEGLLEALTHESPLMRTNSAAALGRLSRRHGPNIHELIVPALTHALGDSEQSVRAAVASALGELGADAIIALPSLCTQIKEGNTRAAWSAAKALGSIGAGNEDVIACLIDALHEHDPSAGDYSSMLQIQAANALGKIGPEANDALPHLKRYLDSDDSGLRRASLNAIQAIEGK